jgi:K+-sensing histidine kinase KdpD
MVSEIVSVLIIDDELSICMGVGGLLEMDGFKVDYVLSAQEGLEFLNAGEVPDIVLLDVNLGQGIDGIETLRLIKEQHKYVQVIMFTSQDSLNIGLECMKRGALDYLTKPFDFKLFSKIAATAIEKKRIAQIHDLYFDMVIHDLKNPLQVISGAYEMLSDTLKDTSTPIQKRLLDATENGVKQIQMIIENVIGITSFEKKTLVARRKLFTIKDVIIPALSIFDAIEIFFEPEVSSICTDKDLFVRVLTNIVSNAVRFATIGSNVSIHFQQTDAVTLLISVTNTGSFIPLELRDVVFDKFLSVRSLTRAVHGQNFGLGLTFSKMAIEAMNGKVWIEGDESVPSTTFKFTIHNYKE